MADEALTKILGMPSIHRPDKHTQRQQWNASWERDLDNAYKNAALWSPPPRVPNQRSSPELRKFVQEAAQQMLLWQEKTLAAIIQLQEDIVKYATVDRHFDVVVREWRGLNDDARRAITLDAFYNVSCAGPDMEGFRNFCPDMTMTKMCANKGQQVVDYLSALNDHWAAKPTTPQFFAHASVTRVKEEMDIDLMARGYTINRAYYVTFAVWRILLGLYDDDESYLVSKSPTQTGVHRNIRNLVREKAKKGEGDEFRTLMQAATERYEQAATEQIRVCWTCGKDPSRSKSGGPLKLCPNCNSIGRKVWYCSIECQKQDWKSGKPRPHREFCGKRLEFEELQETLPVPSSSGTALAAATPGAPSTGPSTATI